MCVQVCECVCLTCYIYLEGCMDGWMGGWKNAHVHIYLGWEKKDIKWSKIFWAIWLQHVQNVAYWHQVYCRWILRSTLNAVLTVFQASCPGWHWQSICSTAVKEGHGGGYASAKQSLFSSSTSTPFCHCISFTQLG